MEPESGRLILGDCEQEMRALEDNSVDAVITDPPYALTSKPHGKGKSNGGFMGKAWDKALPSVAIWRECLRVLKPGGWCLVMSSPRQDCLGRMIGGLEEAGFDTSFSSIYWTYATGFPKAANLSKLADRRAGAEREVVGINPQYCEGRKATVIGHNAGNTRPFLEDERAKDFKKYLTVPATPEAKALDGAYTMSLKPALEVVLVCMKPLSEKSYLDQALANGKGCTWMDDCKIPMSDKDKATQAEKNPHTVKADNAVYDDFSMCKEPWQPSTARFPANLLCEDDVLDDGRVRTGTVDRNLKQGKSSSWFAKGHQRVSRGDSGSFSRYFSLDAWAKENGFDTDGRSPKDTFPFMIVSKPSKAEKNKGLEGFEEKPRANVDKMMGDTKMLTGSGNPRSTKLKNSHATVKPLKLFRWLITLTTRPGDVVLDPFMGSGTTGCAAKETGRPFIGIEIEEESFRIAEARIKACNPPVKP